MCLELEVDVGDIKTEQDDRSSTRDDQQAAFAGIVGCGRITFWRGDICGVISGWDDEGYHKQVRIEWQANLMKLTDAGKGHERASGLSCCGFEVVFVMCDSSGKEGTPEDQ